MTQITDSASSPKHPQNIPNTEDQLNVVLPRLAWGNQISCFKALFKAKKALDNLEKEYSRGNISL